MVYILEGLDCTGKSTCFEALKKRLGSEAVYIKESYVESEEERFSRVQRLGKALDSGLTVIYDRATAIDDLIYSGIIEGKKSIFADHVRLISMIIRAAEVIYFKCDEGVIADRLSKRGDKYLKTPRAIAEIQKSYSDLFETLEVVPTVVDVTFKTPEEVADEVHHIIRRKAFKVAHIVPAGSLSLLDDKAYVMCLAHLVPENESYAAYYRKAAERKDQFVLMDNGAAENAQLSMDDLLKVYDTIHPDEVVLPDTIFDAKETLKKSFEGLRIFKSHPGFDSRIMAVPQGRTIEEWMDCAETFVQCKDINTIGISKFLHMETQYSEARMVAAAWINRLMAVYDRNDLEVHMLGLSEEPNVVYEVQTLYPFVRGCDTAYGYIAANGSESIRGDMERPEGEIDFIDGEEPSNLKEVLTDLELELGAFQNGPDSTWAKGRKS